VVWHLNGLLSSPKTGRKAVQSYLSRLETLQEEAGRGLRPILRRLAELNAEEEHLDGLYIKGRYDSCPEKYDSALAEIQGVRRTLEAQRSKRQREIDEFETRRAEIDRIRAAIAEDRFNVFWRPSVNKLRVTLFREPEAAGEPFNFADDEPGYKALQPRTKRARQKALVKTRKRRSALQVFEEECVEGRGESDFDLRQLLELFDINVVVHSDYVEMRGALPRSMSIGLEEIGQVALLPSSTGMTRRGRPGGRSRSSPRQPGPALSGRSSAAPGRWRRRRGRP
jgi:hypothetical protein